MSKTTPKQIPIPNSKIKGLKAIPSTKKCIKAIIKGTIQKVKKKQNLSLFVTFSLSALGKSYSKVKNVPNIETVKKR